MAGISPADEAALGRPRARLRHAPDNSSEILGHGIARAEAYSSDQERNITLALRRALRRRSAIDPTIDQEETGGARGGIPPKGMIGDPLFTIRLIRASLRRTAAAILLLLHATIISITGASRPRDPGSARQA